ncbi:MAG: energy transducer TonB [Daejeonella sp.]
MAYREENNYPKALLVSSVTMGVLLFISYFIVISMPFKQEDVGIGGIIVNYGTADAGMGEDYMSVDEPSVDPNANQTSPDKVITNTDPDNNPTTESSDKTVFTQDAEDATSVITKDKSENSNPSTSNPTTENKPVVNANALYKGKKNHGTGRGDGTGTTPGNQGTKDGDPLAPNYGQGGSGFGGVSLNLDNRKFVDLPNINDQGQSTGRIAVKIWVDKTGEVVNAQAGVQGTTITGDLNLLRKCEAAARGAKLNQLESAPDVQIGVVIFNFKVK